MIKSGQYVKVFFRTGMMAEGYVNQWSEEASSLSSEDGDLFIINNTKEDLIAVKVCAFHPSEEKAQAKYLCDMCGLAVGYDPDTDGGPIIIGGSEDTGDGGPFTNGAATMVTGSGGATSGDGGVPMTSGAIYSDPPSIAKLAEDFSGQNDLTEEEHIERMSKLKLVELHREKIREEEEQVRQRMNTLEPTVRRTEYGNPSFRAQPGTTQHTTKKNTERTPGHYGRMRVMPGQKPQ